MDVVMSTWADPQKGGRRPESELTTRFYFRVKT